MLSNSRNDDDKELTLIQEFHKNLQKFEENTENISPQQKEKNIKNNLIYQKVSKNIGLKSNYLKYLKYPLIISFISILLILIINISTINKYPQLSSNKKLNSKITNSKEQLNDPLNNLKNEEKKYNILNNNTNDISSYKYLVQKVVNIKKNSNSSDLLTKQQIDKLLENCNNSEIYNNIQKEFFKNNIYTPNIILHSLKFPNLPKYEIEKNINKNIDILINYVYKINENTDLYNSLSCIFGSFLADALGSYCEFKMPSRENSKLIFVGNNNFNVEKGSVTDDSEMGMALAFSIMDSYEKNILNADFISYYYGLWHSSSPNDIGSTTVNALQYFEFYNYKLLDNNNNSYFDEVKNKIKNVNNHSLTNGYLMRKSVFYVFVFYRYYQQIKIAFEEAEKNNLIKLYELFNNIKNISKIDNECTHPNPETTTASAYTSLMALGALQKIEPSKIITYILNMIKLINENSNLNADNLDIELGKYIENMTNIFSDEKFDFWSYFTSKENNVYDYIGWYKHSFRLILYFMTNFDNVNKNKGEKNIFRYIIDNICDIGGDTDTNAAIVGSVIGPLIGYNVFKDDLNYMLKLGRKMYYPIFMVLYLDYLEKSMKNNELIYNRKNFIKMIATIIYGRIDENNLLF